jgi:nucleotide-binding universal stress UspA family protein
MTENKDERPRIVVGVDGSEESKSALRWAARMADVFGARIEALMVWEFVATYGWAALPPLSPPHPELDERLDKLVTEVLGADRPEGMILRVVEGSAAGCIVAESKDAELVVVGSRGHGGFAGLLMGSVSAKVAEHAHCPVLVVHGDGPAAVHAA